MAEPAKSTLSPALDTPLMAHSNFILAAGLVTILATLIVPLPTPLLDMLLACSISLAVAILIITLSAKESLELSTFPSLLLFTTLFPPVSERRLNASDTPAGQRRQNHPDLRQLRRGRQLRRRPGDIPHTRRHPVRRNHQRRRKNQRSGREIHTRRYARKTNGHRRRPQRRAYHRTAGQ